MIEFTFHTTDPAGFYQEGNGAKAGVERVPNSDSGCGNEQAVIEAAKQADLPPGRYIAIQSDSDNSADVIGWSWIIDVIEPTTKEARIVK